MSDRLTEAVARARDLVTELASVRVDKGIWGSPMTVRCAQGHVWRTRVKAILYGSWCPRCAVAQIVAAARRHHGTLDLGDTDEIAFWAEPQGLEFVEGDTPRQGRTDFFRCDAGHVWEVSRRSPAGPWCPVCGTRGAATGVGRVAL